MARITGVNASSPARLGTLWPDHCRTARRDYRLYSDEHGRAHSGDSPGLIAAFPVSQVKACTQ
jgi:hypothetical protein